VRAYGWQKSVRRPPAANIHFCRAVIISAGRPHPSLPAVPPDPATVVRASPSTYYGTAALSHLSLLSHEDHTDYPEYPVTPESSSLEQIYDDSLGPISFQAKIKTNPLTNNL
jgi:hypothetical protein